MLRQLFQLGNLCIGPYPWNSVIWTGLFYSICVTVSFLPPALAVEVIKTESSVCLSVCQLALSRLNHLAYGHEIQLDSPKLHVHAHANFAHAKNREICMRT